MNALACFRRARTAVLTIAAAALPVLAAAQGVAAELWTSGSQVLTPGVYGPNYLAAPTSALVVGPRLWVGQEVRGWRNLPRDPLGQLPTGEVFDTIPVAQMAMDPSRLLLYWAESDKKRGTVVRYGYDATTGEPAVGGYCRLPGLAGRVPEGIAIGPDGRLYIGLDTSGDILRIDTLAIAWGSCPASVAITTIGRSAFGGRVTGLAFVGNDLYIAGKDGLGVIANATACVAGCSAVVVPGSVARTNHVGISSDGAGRVFYLRDNRAWMYRVADGSHTLVSAGGVYPDGTAVGFAFVNGQSNVTLLDPAGNLWIGDDTSNGQAAQTGRLWLVRAENLPR